MADRAQARRDAAGNPDASVTHVHGSPVRRGQATVSDRSQPTQQAHYNTRSTAAALANERSYLDRPLPAPPLGEKMLLERPSTSGGPSSKTQSASGVSKFNSKYNNNKRVSRDDFYVKTTISSGSKSEVYGTQQYAASHGHLPSSDLTSPRTKSYKHQFSTSHGNLPRPRAPSQPAVPVVRLTTPDTMSDQSAPIGMALGSPTHPPEMWNSGTTLRPQPVQPATSPLSSVESIDSFDMPKEKKQPGKRRLFGLFGRKRSEVEPSPVSISEPNQLGRAYRPDQQVPSHSPNEARPKHSRSKTAHDHKTLTQKTPVKRSQTLPDAHDQSSTLAPTGMRVKGPSIDTQRSTANFGSIPIVLDSPTQESTPAPSFLNIEIPKSNMERYSVMFQGVLGPQPSSTSSLLARRQATSKELKKISDSIIAEEVSLTIPNCSHDCAYLTFGRTKMRNWQGLGGQLHHSPPNHHSSFYFQLHQRADGHHSRHRRQTDHGKQCVPILHRHCFHRHQKQRSTMHSKLMPRLATLHNITLEEQRYLMMSSHQQHQPRDFTLAKMSLGSSLSLP